MAPATRPGFWTRLKYWLLPWCDQPRRPEVPGPPPPMPFLSEATGRFVIVSHYGYTDEILYRTTRGSWARQFWERAVARPNEVLEFRDGDLVRAEKRA